MWDGFWFLANRRAWEKLPEDVRAIVAKNINAAAINELNRYWNSLGLVSAAG